MLLLDVLPFLLIWTLFTFLYIFMPNTKVRFRSGLIAQLAATLAGATYHFLFGAKGPDIFSDTVYNMGAKVIITVV